MKIVPFFVFIVMTFEEIIDDFNNGELDVTKYFNNYQTFFSILKKRGYMSMVDPTAPDSSEWQNEYLIWLYEEDRKKFYEYVVTLLNSDLIMDDSGNIFLETTDRGSFSKLFCSNRNDISRDTIEQILSGEDAFDPYWDTTDDVYRDVIEELTPENDKRLQEYIVDILNGREVEPEGEELELIASEQGHPEFAIITSENVKRIIDDEESMNYLLNNGLEDLKSELYSIHSSSYNSAYEEQVYDDIFDKINEYFNGNGEWSSRPHTYKKDTMVEIFKIPVASNFDSVILDYLNYNKGYGSSGTLEYWGSYLSILDESVDCLSVYSPDYPDSRLIDKNINMYFKDYL
jgi:hypothetical protein